MWTITKNVKLNECSIKVQFSAPLKNGFCRLATLFYNQICSFLVTTKIMTVRHLLHFRFFKKEFAFEEILLIFFPL